MSCPFKQNHISDVDMAAWQDRNFMPVNVPGLVFASSHKITFSSGPF